MAGMENANISVTEQKRLNLLYINFHKIVYLYFINKRIFFLYVNITGERWSQPSQSNHSSHSSQSLDACVCVYGCVCVHRTAVYICVRTAREKKLFVWGIHQFGGY